MRIMSQNCSHVVCVVVFPDSLSSSNNNINKLYMTKREIISSDDIETWESDNK